jgi:hypothetical protein
MTKRRSALGVPSAMSPIRQSGLRGIGNGTNEIEIVLRPRRIVLIWKFKAQLQFSALQEMATGTPPSKIEAKPQDFGRQVRAAVDAGAPVLSFICGIPPSEPLCFLEPLLGNRDLYWCGVGTLMPSRIQRCGCIVIRGPGNDSAIRVHRVWVQGGVDLRIRAHLSAAIDVIASDRRTA